MLLKEHNNPESKVKIMFALLLRFEWSDFLWNLCIFLWKSYTAAWFREQKVLKRSYQGRRTELHVFHSLYVSAQATSVIFIFKDSRCALSSPFNHFEVPVSAVILGYLLTFSLPIKDMENV